MFAVVAHEEVRIGKAGADDVVVALYDQLAALEGLAAGGRLVGDGDVVRQQLGLHAALEDREVALVLLHYRDEHLARQGEVGGVKGAQQGLGGFHQVGHLCQQARFICRLAAYRGRQGRHLGLDGGFAGFGVQQDALLFQEAEISGSILNYKFFGLVEAQAARAVAGAQPGVFKGDGLLAQQGQEPAQGPREGHVAAVPAHGFVEAQACHQAGQGFSQHLGCRAAGLAHQGGHIAPAVDLANLQVFELHAFAAGKALAGFGGLAQGVESPVGRRAFDHLLQVGLAGGHIFHISHQAARRTLHAHRPMRQAQLIQQGRQARAQLLQGGGQVADGQLFAADLDQERGGGGCGGWGWEGGLNGGGAGGGIFLQPGVFQLLALFKITLSHAARELAHAPEEGLALGQADGAARVEHVEGVRALEDVIVSGQDQLLIQAGGRLLLVQVVHLLQAFHVGHVEVIGAVLALALQVDVTGGEGVAALGGGVPADLGEAVDAL